MCGAGRTGTVRAAGGASRGTGQYRLGIRRPAPVPLGAAAGQFYVLGYKGTSAYDAGMFYCPYVPLQMVRAMGEDTFQPKIGFKTRYGMVDNPFVTPGAGTLAGGGNPYYRKVRVANLM